jgi:hypothetical protein
MIGFYQEGQANRIQNNIKQHRITSEQQKNINNKRNKRN